MKSSIIHSHCADTPRSCVNCVLCAASPTMTLSANETPAMIITSWCPALMAEIYPLTTTPHTWQQCTFFLWKVTMEICSFPPVLRANICKVLRVHFNQQAYVSTAVYCKPLFLDEMKKISRRTRHFPCEVNSMNQNLRLYWSTWVAPSAHVVIRKKASETKI